ncbi:MAG TPA: cytochrome c biogenesis protein CcdA [Ferruginibacter sp.]|nr:cytochrome c biogenesis protein CcdA [Ferruginibacter sp.]
MFRLPKFLLVFLLFTSAAKLYGQDNIVKWKAEAKKISTGLYELKIKGVIGQGWHVYTAPNETEGLTGIVITFNDSSVITKELQLITPALFINDPVFENKNLQVAKDSVVFIQQIKVNGSPAALRIKINYDGANDDNFIPGQQSILLQLNETPKVNTSNRILISSINLNSPVSACGESASNGTQAGSGGLLSLFFLGFLGGLVALLTPCVFPMIPLTVSFFTKKAASRKTGIRNAFMYAFFILLIYVLLSLPFHFLDSLNPEILNNISTNVYLNVFFFAIFVFFAFSFFGYYEITLPGSISNRADSKSGAGNVAGIFFMALTLALVSFSCTGPILGSLLAGSLSGDGGAIQLTAGMAGFGLALALPFGLFALFPNWLNSLPKSGGWLNTVKVVLGFIELGLAFKFLSNADLVKHWGLLKREIFIGLWIIIGIGLTLYLFGLLKFRHDLPKQKISKNRLLLAIVTGLFTLYLIPGLTNSKSANLSLISGFPPPLYYSIYKSGNDCVLDLNCTRDYEEGLRMAREQGKAILLDFTGYACVNCRRMEENVWSQEDVYQLMKEKFIVISLYVDDKKQLPAEQQFTYTTKDGDEKDIITVGDKWAAFETENFRNNAQPWYVILDTDEKLLTHPVGYVPSGKEYLIWLQCGLDAFNKK